MRNFFILYAINKQKKETIEHDFWHFFFKVPVEYLELKSSGIHDLYAIKAFLV